MQKNNLEPHPGGGPAKTNSISLTDLIGPETGARMVGQNDEMSPAEVARELGISTPTVRRWETRARPPLLPVRRLPGSGYRRYRRADVLALKKRIEDEGADVLKWDAPK